MCQPLPDPSHWALASSRSRSGFSPSATSAGFSLTAHPVKDGLVFAISSPAAVSPQALPGLKPLRFESDEEYHHRFRLFIQPGVQSNSTEIEVVHDQKPADGEASEQWPSDSVSDEREKNMVDVLANALAADITSGTVSLLAQNIGGEEKVEVLTPGGADPYLLLKLDFDRAWASVGYSLERGGFTTRDQNRSEGLFYVNYTPEDEDKPGFFGRLFSFGGDSAEEVNYQVHVDAGDKGIEVRVTDENGNAVERSQAIRLLKGVRANLS